MAFGPVFFANSILLGAGLAMDAFSVSVVSGLTEPDMPFSKKMTITGTFAAFQFAMPMVGWICVHTIMEYFTAFQKLVPWIAFILLSFIGGKMLLEAREMKHSLEQEGGGTVLNGRSAAVGAALVMQGIATSIDALSVGFTIAHYGLLKALTASLIIAAVTEVICLAGVWIGKLLGTRLSWKANVLGGLILIGIGLEVFFS